MGGFGLKSGLSPSADDVRLCERVQRIVAADVLGPNRLPQLLRIGDVRDLGRFGGRLGDVAGRRCVSWLGVGLGEFQIGGKATNSWVSRSSGKAASQDPSGISGVCSVIADQRRPDQPCGVGGCKTCQNGFVADIAEGKARKTRYVDHGWPTTDPDDHAVSELVTDRTGALSPFGELTFPVPSDDLPYIHPVTVINR